MKPLFSQNVKLGNDTVLIENGKLVKNPESVANIMNSYYVDVAADISKADSLNGTDTVNTINEA